MFSCSMINQNLNKNTKYNSNPTGLSRWGLLVLKRNNSII